MTGENKDEKSNDHYNNLVLKMIYDDSKESFKILRDDLNSINTRLTLVIGFNATLVGLLSKLPMQEIFLLKVSSLQIYDVNLPSIKMLANSVRIANWILSVKPLITILIIFSLLRAILSVLPSALPVVISPKKMLLKSKNLSEEDFKIIFIENRDETIKKIQDLMTKKASNLRYALLALCGAAILTVLDILTNADVPIS